MDENDWKKIVAAWENYCTWLLSVLIVSTWLRAQHFSCRNSPKRPRKHFVICAPISKTPSMMVYCSATSRKASVHSTQRALDMKMTLMAIISWKRFAMQTTLEIVRAETLVSSTQIYLDGNLIESYVRSQKSIALRLFLQHRWQFFVVMNATDLQV